MLEIHGQRNDGNKGWLTIYSLNGGLIIHPNASNVIDLESKKR